MIEENFLLPCLILSDIFEKLTQRAIKTLYFEIKRIYLYSLELHVLYFSLRKTENCRYYEPLSEELLKNPLLMVSVIQALADTQKIKARRESYQLRV